VCFSCEIEEFSYFEVNFVVRFTMHSAVNVFGVDDESHRACIAALVSELGTTESTKKTERASSFCFSKTERGTNDPKRISSKFRHLERKILKNR